MIPKHEHPLAIKLLTTAVPTLHSFNLYSRSYFPPAEPQSCCTKTGVTFSPSCPLITLPVRLGELRRRGLEGCRQKVCEKGEDKAPIGLEVCAVPRSVQRPRRVHHTHGRTTWKGLSTSRHSSSCVLTLPFLDEICTEDFFCINIVGLWTVFVLSF